MTEQTALVGHVQEEFNCLPVENEEFRLISERKALEALKPKKETVFIDKLPGKLLQQRHALPGEQSAFVVCSFWAYLVDCSWLILSLASNEAHEAQSTGEQDYSYAAERAVGSCLRMFPRIQILAV